MKNTLLFFVAIVSLSQAANLVRLAQAPALMIGFWRLLGAGLIMFGLKWLNSRRQNQSFLEYPPRETWRWTFLSGSLFFVHLWTFFVAAQTTSIATCMILFASNPIFTAIGSWIFLKDRFEKRHGVAFALAFTGIYLLASDKISWSQGWSGEVSAIFSAACFSGYILAGKKARGHVSNEQYAWVIYLWTALLFFIVGSLQHVQWIHYPPITWIAISANILGPTLLGHVLFTYLLKYMNINWMSCGKLMEPAISALVATFLFGELVTPSIIAAFVMTVLASIALLSRQWRINS